MPWYALRDGRHERAGAAPRLPRNIATFYFLVQSFRPIELNSGFAQQIRFESEQVRFKLMPQFNYHFICRLLPIFFFEYAETDISSLRFPTRRNPFEIFSTIHVIETNATSSTTLHSAITPRTYIRTQNTCPLVHIDIKQCRTETISFDWYPFNRSKCQFMSFIFIVHQRIGETAAFGIKGKKIVYLCRFALEKWVFYSDVHTDDGTNSLKHESMNRLLHSDAHNSTWSASKQMSIHFWMMETTHRACTSTPVIQSYDIKSHIECNIRLFDIFSSWFVDSFYFGGRIAHSSIPAYTHTHTKIGKW